MPRGASTSSGIGSTIAGRVRRNVNDAGSTPMTSAGLPSMTSGWPMTFVGAAESALPVAVGQDHPPRRAGRIVLVAEGATENRLHAQQWQCRRTDEQSLHTLRDRRPR